MLYIERWKVIAILAIVLWGAFYAMPNVLGKETLAWMQAHLPAAFPTKTVNLGLDLRGGSHLLLQVDLDAAMEEKTQGLLDQMRTDLRKEKIGYTDLAQEGTTVRLTLVDAGMLSKAKDVLRAIDRDLDVQVEGVGGVSVRMSERQLEERRRSAMDQSIEIVRRRIDETGTREPSIQRQGDDRILVQLPGVDDPERIKNLLGQTAKLSFRLVDESSLSGATRVPPGAERLPDQDEAGRTWIVQKRVMVSGDMLVDAQPSFQEGMPVVSFRFDGQGGRRFGEATRANVGRPFAIILDGKVISAPVIREPILGGSGVISGNFTTQSAQDLALLLRAGALPAPIKVLEERTVGPGLGADSIKAGTYACLVGIGLVMLGSLIAYGGVFGGIANLGLFVNVALVFAVLSFLQATLTLPGIAGIVLTVGMAVDANVLIYERIREEVRLGRSAIVALDAGFKHALSSIVDANLTTLIAAMLLFLFGSGPIKGFAVTLSIGILSSIFTAVTFSRLVTIFWSRAAKPKSLPL